MALANRGRMILSPYVTEIQEVHDPAILNLALLVGLDCLVLLGRVNPLVPVVKCVLIEPQERTERCTTMPHAHEIANLVCHVTVKGGFIPLAGVRLEPLTGALHLVQRLTAILVRELV